MANPPLSGDVTIGAAIGGSSGRADSVGRDARLTSHSKVRTDSAPSVHLLVQNLGHLTLDPAGPTCNCGGEGRSGVPASGTALARLRALLR
jgi:hypothetical protein